MLISGGFVHGTHRTPLGDAAEPTGRSIPSHGPAEPTTVPAEALWHASRRAVAWPSLGWSVLPFCVSLAMRRPL